METYLDMKHCNSTLYSLRLQLLIIVILVVTLVSCNGKYNKEFWGTYENNDTNRHIFSRISFYDDSTYSFYSSSCFDITRDSGNFIFANDTISFQSCGLPLSDTGRHKIRSLDKVSFLHKLNKILYVRQLTAQNKSSYFDTVLIGQKKF
jgi:hypothetical protein